jgi:hypothetical protein
MIQDEHIDAAVTQGILTADQAERLRGLARSGPAERPEPHADPDDEKFRLIGGFNDVFVTIGVGLLIAALFALAGALGFNVGFAVLAMIAAWGLSEFFSRHMRLALPSIALALMFAGAGALVAFSLGGAVLGGDGGEIIWRGGAHGRLMSWGMTSLFLGVGAAIAAVVHERRFHVPIDMAIAASAIVCMLSGLLGTIAPEWTQKNWSLLMGLFGLGVFAVAVRFDASDPGRQTRRSDVAFWLHMLAAPMIVRSVMPLATGGTTEIDALRAVFILAVFAILALVALVIDRRALLVSGLTYAGIAIAYLLSQSVDQEGLGLSLTLLSLAALVLALSAGWRSLRRAIVPRLPLGRWRSHVPPTT